MKPINFQLSAIAVPFGAGSSVILSPSTSLRVNSAKDLPSERVITGYPLLASQRPERVVEGPSQDDNALVASRGFAGLLRFARNDNGEPCLISKIGLGIKTFAEDHPVAVKAFVVGALMAAGLVSEPGVSDALGQMTLPLAFGVLKKTRETKTASPLANACEEAVRMAARIGELERRLEEYSRPEQLKTCSQKSGIRLRKGNLRRQVHTFNELTRLYQRIINGINGAIEEALKNAGISDTREYSKFPDHIKQACLKSLAYLRQLKDVTKRECEFFDKIGARVPEVCEKLMGLLSKEASILFDMGKKGEWFATWQSVIATGKKLAEIYYANGDAEKEGFVYRRLAMDYAHMTKELLRDDKVKEAVDAYQKADEMLEALVLIQLEKRDAEGLYMSRSTQVRFLDELIGLLKSTGDNEKLIKVLKRKLDVITAGHDEAVQFKHERFLEAATSAMPAALFELGDAYLAIGDNSTAAALYQQSLEAAGVTVIPVMVVPNVLKRAQVYNEGGDMLKNLKALMQGGLGDADPAKAAQAFYRECAAILSGFKKDMDKLKLRLNDENEKVAGEEVNRMQETAGEITALLNRVVLLFDGNEEGIREFKRSITVMVGGVNELVGDMFLEVARVLAGTDQLRHDMLGILHMYMRAKDAFEEALKFYSSSGNKGAKDNATNRIHSAGLFLTRILRKFDEIISKPSGPGDKVAEEARMVADALQRIRAMHERDNAHTSLSQTLVEIISSIGEKFGGSPAEIEEGEKYLM